MIKKGFLSEYDNKEDIKEICEKIKFIMKVIWTKFEELYHLFIILITSNIDFIYTYAKLIAWNSYNI